ncbi:MAG: DUF1624 domain-containing protein [Parvularculaceae bacterium]|nr:DUF1624 domain-containing protein [Parvularculaceae bacterium]
MNGVIAPAPRMASIDIMRGLVIVLMMMDHVRERFYMHVRVGDPMHDWVEPDMFFTRLVTHICAPVFIFLAGLSAWLYAHPKGGESRSPSGFLFKRGLVIIMIELVFYYLLWIDSYPSFMFLQVLFAIGAAMVMLSLATRMNYWLIGALGFAIVLGHNALEPIEIAQGDPGYVIWAILHDGGDLFSMGGLTVQLSYPVLPWFGVILLGYFAGPLFGAGVVPQLRLKALVAIGVICLLSLAVLRGFNIYGEAEPWTQKGSLLKTVMGFLNFTKYPPSLDYILFTLGVALPALAWFETFKMPNRVLGWLQTFGSVPMFVYVLHLYVLLAAYWVLFPIFGPNQGVRFGLPNVQLIWLGAVILTVIMYPLAKVFALYKHRQKGKQPWLSYL